MKERSLHISWHILRGRSTPRVLAEPPRSRRHCPAGLHKTKEPQFNPTLSHLIHVTLGALLNLFPFLASEEAGTYVKCLLQCQTHSKYSIKAAEDNSAGGDSTFQSHIRKLMAMSNSNTSIQETS